MVQENENDLQTFGLASTLLQELLASEASLRKLEALEMTTIICILGYYQLLKESKLKADGTHIGIPNPTVAG